MRKGLCVTLMHKVYMKRKITLKGYTVKYVLSDHAWAKKKWSLNRGGLLIEVKMHCKVTIGTPSGL